MSAGWLAGAALLWAAAVAAATGIALWRTRSRPVRGEGGPPPETLVVRPLSGADPWLSRTLARLFDHPPVPGVVVRLTVSRGDDPAWPVARAVAQAGAVRGWDAEAWVVPPGPDSHNHKVAQLAGAVARAAPCEVVVGVDADVPLTPEVLDRLRGALGGATGAAWVPVAEDGGRTLGDRASAAVLSGSLHAFPLLGGIDPGGLVGKLFAVRSEALAAVGGLRAFEDTLGEDMALAEQLRRAGWGVARVAPGLVSAAQGRSLAEVVARFARWLQVIRFQRPERLVGYPGLFLATGPILLLAALGGGAAPGAAWTAVALALGARLAAAVGARRRSGLPTSPLAAGLDVLLAEAVLWAAFGLALSRRTIEWRGRRLRVGPAGRLRSQ